MKRRILLLNLVGGLGNQLFQYACCRNLAEKYNAFLIIETGSYWDGFRKPSITNYNVKARFYEDKFFGRLKRAGLNIYKSFKRAGLLQEIIEPPNFSYTPQLLVVHKNLITIRGFWQSEEYFKNIRDALINELTPKVPINSKDIKWLQYAETVAVHVRRTDYLTDDRYGFIGMEYYRRSFNSIAEKISNPYFIIFSDDIDWCKKNFTDLHPSIIFHEEKNYKEDFHELLIMSYCKHQIIANSSFSWWAAWLNCNNNKIIIRPSRPFRDSSVCNKNYYPGSWIAL
jgi:hypothetical protein